MFLDVVEILVVLLTLTDQIYACAVALNNQINFVVLVNEVTFLGNNRFLK